MGEKGLNLIGAAGLIAGYLYCFWAIAFRWKTLRRKYGRLDLILWANYVLFGFAFGAWLLVVAIWSAQRLFQ
jgi:hypothetical protein